MTRHDAPWIVMAVLTAYMTFCAVQLAIVEPYHISVGEVRVVNNKGYVVSAAPYDPFNLPKVARGNDLEVDFIVERHASGFHLVERIVKQGDKIEYTYSAERPFKSGTKDVLNSFFDIPNSLVTLCKDTYVYARATYSLKYNVLSWAFPGVHVTPKVNFCATE